MKITVKSILDKINNIIMNAYLSGKPKSIDKKTFFDNYRIEFGALNQSQVDSLDKFIDLTNENIKEFSVNQWAYVYATTHHETNTTFEPVKEAYWVENAEAWRKKNLRYYPYYGRGFVQLTWLDNYKKYADLFDVNIVENPDLVMDFELSFNVMVHGMKNGTYTGKKLSNYISTLISDYVGARFVINGKRKKKDKYADKAEDISVYAHKFERILKVSIS